MALILGDNIFFGHGLVEMYLNSIKFVEKNKEAVVFGYGVKNPNRYGVVEFNSKKEVISIEENPDIPKTNFGVPGLYIYDNSVVSFVKDLIPLTKVCK